MSISVGIQAAMAYSVNTLVDLLTGNALAQLEKDREMMRLLEGLGGKDGGTEAPGAYTATPGGGAALGVGLAAAAASIGVALRHGRESRKHSMFQHRDRCWCARDLVC